MYSETSDSEKQEKEELRAQANHETIAIKDESSKESQIIIDDKSKMSFLKLIAEIFLNFVFILRVCFLGHGDAAHWPIRESLFPNVSPYIKFNSHDAEVPFVLPEGRRYLKWKLSTITPILVRKTLINTGFRLVRSEFTRGLHP